MKNALTGVVLLVCSCFIPITLYANEKGELHVRVEVTTGERSRDSSFQKTTITLASDRMVWEQSYGGRRGGTPSARKEYILQRADTRKLEKFIKSRKKLFVTTAIKLEQNSSTFGYFDLSLDLTLEGRTGAVRIEGPKSAIRVNEETMYQEIIILVKELYRVINRIDKSVSYDGLEL